MPFGGDRTTLGALAAPRRAVPLAVVLVAMLGSEWAASGSVAACGIDLALFVAFCAIAPASWRAAAARARARPPGIDGYLSYAVLGGLVVLGAALLPRTIGRPGTYVVDPPSVGLLWVLFLVGGWGLGRDIDLEAGIESAERRAERLALEAERARVLAMRAQLDPHFLFNTLNAIAEWCREDPATAERATLDLAAMLRAISEGTGRPSWPLARELVLLEQLTKLYAVRDPERYRFALDLGRPPPEVEVPPMLLLPLIENAITHGPGAGHAGEIRVRAAPEGEGAVLEIENPGAFAGRREGGQGIAMVERRLALAYGEAATLVIERVGEGTRTRVSVPRAPAAAEVIGAGRAAIAGAPR